MVVIKVRIVVTASHASGAALFVVTAAALTVLPVTARVPAPAVVLVPAAAPVVPERLVEARLAAAASTPRLFVAVPPAPLVGPRERPFDSAWLFENPC